MVEDEHSAVGVGDGVTMWVGGDNVGGNDKVERKGFGETEMPLSDEEITSEVSLVERESHDETLTGSGISTEVMSISEGERWKL